MTYGHKRYGNSSYHKEPEIVEIPLPVIPDVIHSGNKFKENKGGLFGKISSLIGLDTNKENKGGLLGKISSLIGFEIKAEDLIIIGLILLFIFNKDESQDDETDFMIPILLYLLF